MTRDRKRLIIAKLLRLRTAFEKACARLNYKGGSVFRSKIFLGAVSLCISVLLWSLVATGDSTESTRTIKDGIDYVNLRAGFSVDVHTKEVEIKLEGKNNELATVKPSDVASTVDLTNLRTGRYTLPVRIEAPSLAHVRDWQPALVEVDVYRNMERRAEIKPKTRGEAPSGKVVSSIALNPDHAVVRGPEADVLTLQGLEAVIDLDRLAASGKVTVPVVIRGASSAGRSQLVAAPSEVEATVAFEDEIIAESIPVSVSVAGSPRAGLRVESVKVVPDRVSIRGSSAAVKSIESLALPPVDITGLEQDIQLIVPMEPMQLPPGVEITGADRARVEIHLSKQMKTKTFADVPLMIAGNSASKEWRFSPPAVSLTIEGYASAVEKLDGKKPPCELYVDVSNIVSQHADLPVLVRGLRSGFRVVRTDPEQVKAVSVE